VRSLDPFHVAELLEPGEDELVIKVSTVESVEQVRARLERLLVASWALACVDLVLVIDEPFLE
jgi:hypothetical protein